MTRTALRRPYRSDNPRYLPFHNRMTCLRLLTLEDRSTIASIKLGQKIIKSNLDMPINSATMSYLNTRIRTRSANTFVITRDVPYKSPLHIMMTDVNHHRQITDITKDSPQQIQTQLTRYFTEIQRTNLQPE